MPKAFQTYEPRLDVVVETANLVVGLQRIGTLGAAACMELQSCEIGENPIGLPDISVWRPVCRELELINFEWNRDTVTARAEARTKGRSTVRARARDWSRNLRG